MDFLAVISPETVEAWFEWGGYFILFGLLFACGLGLPMPEDIPLLLAGFFIAQGKMNVVIACMVAWLGIIGGDCMLYSFGRRYGLEITRVPFIGKHVTKERILRAEELFERWGIWVVAIGRMPAVFVFEKVRGKSKNCPCISIRNLPPVTSRMRGHSVYQPCAGSKASEPFGRR